MSDDVEFLLSGDFDTARIIRAFQTPDDIGVISRVHFQLDVVLHNVVLFFEAHPAKLKHWGVNRKITALESFGVRSGRVKPAIIINKLRNIFAHEGKENFEESDILELELALKKIFIGKITNDFSFNYPGEESGSKYGDMNNRRKYLLLGLFAVSAVSVVPDEFSKETNALGEGCF